MNEEERGSQWGVTPTQWRVTPPLWRVTPLWTPVEGHTTQWRVKPPPVEGHTTPVEGHTTPEIQQKLDHNLGLAPGGGVYA